MSRIQKRHRWSRGNGWMVCDDCGCRYRTGNLTREYEQPDGRRTADAERCLPRGCGIAAVVTEDGILTGHIPVAAIKGLLGVDTGVRGRRYVSAEQRRLLQVHPDFQPVPNGSSDDGA